MSAVIKVEGLSKKYCVGEAPAKSLREAFERMRKSPSVSKSEFWALKDISFEVQRGEIIGVIGRNGAGKSTLLKILSRITEPTAGRASIQGRFASLLEVGTGFHPELTGRENIYLNGTMLGMRKHEISARLDQIIAFADIEKFIDTPVKRYSSGMYVRLAFAVAAHLESEILFFDEVLAVGDVAFQRKCLGKIGELTKVGRTILFVSHNLAAVENLCRRGLLLTKGSLTHQGPVRDVLSRYLIESREKGEKNGGALAKNAEGTLRLASVDFTDLEGKKIEVIRSGMSLNVRLALESDISLKDLNVTIGINNAYDLRVSLLHSRIAGYPFSLTPGQHVLTCRIKDFPLAAGVYFMDVKVVSGKEPLIWLPAAAEMPVEAGDYYGSGRIPEAQWAGVCYLNQNWSVDPNGK